MDFVRTQAQTRFSDFNSNGQMHFSKCLMYFEKARFAISRDAGLEQILKACYPGAEIQFVVVKTEIRYLEPVGVTYDRDGDRALVVETQLCEPFISKLTFRQKLVQKGGDRVLVDASVDVALLDPKEGMIRLLSEECRQCLTDYLRSHEGIREL